ncbi:hypothetical protein DDJ72_04065 [Mycobacteroides abscessus]|uniref:hypothetical protein n=1 Tax=Mycobacteroides abscessus TaxID=36809 RepID=UPI000D3E9361|nr:hypothetical protein [Mycobacteroides abscessus]PVA58076.1 hypothetical protein DDJ72_04065 [Mycobacteroides abscessus]
MANDVNDIAAKWNAVFGQSEPQATAPEVEPDAEPGKGNVIPSAGNQPNLTDEQLAALAAQAHGPETFDQKNRRLAGMFEPPQTIWHNH